MADAPDALRETLILSFKVASTLCVSGHTQEGHEGYRQLIVEQLSLGNFASTAPFHPPQLPTMRDLFLNNVHALCSCVTRRMVPMVHVHAHRETLERAAAACAALRPHPLYDALILVTFVRGFECVAASQLAQADACYAAGERLAAEAEAAAAQGALPLTRHGREKLAGCTDNRRLLLEMEPLPEGTDPFTLPVQLHVPSQPPKPQLQLCDACAAQPGTQACTGCREAAYCSVACQRSAWPAHKAQCKQAQKEREQALLWERLLG
jgi:hypothetical protein